MADSLYAGNVLTPQVTTGDWTTVNDAYNATDYDNMNGARNPLGYAYWFIDSSGRLKKCRYVRYNPTANVALSSSVLPGPCYWKDNTFTVVTGTLSEALTGTPNFIAGYMVNVNTVNGNYVFIQVAGYLASAIVAASTAVGDTQIGTTGAFTPARVAAGTASTYKPAAYAEVAIASSKANVNVAVESL